jgi:hypothetical protein
MNGNGHALLVWNATGDARYAERIKGAPWQASRPVPGAATAAGPVATAIGSNEVAAIAYVTVATRYVPAKLMVTWRSAGAGFGAAVEPAPGAAAGDVRLGVDCDGTITLLWANAIGVYVSSLAGTGATAGACNGQPGGGAWAAPMRCAAVVDDEFGQPRTDAGGLAGRCPRQPERGGRGLPAGGRRLGTAGDGVRRHRACHLEPQAGARRHGQRCGRLPRRQQHGRRQAACRRWLGRAGDRVGGADRLLPGAGDERGR